MRRAPLLLFAALAAPTIERSSFAEDPPRPAHPLLLDRPHTVAEFEVGVIALPDVPISSANRGGATFVGTVGNGDATVQTGLHLLYRATREWAFGAGALFAPNPTSDRNYVGTGRLVRTHARSYLLLGGELRYVPLRTRWIEGWLGLTAGAVVIADRFTTNGTPAVPAILGRSTVTVSSEGFAFGVQAGADYLLTDQWVLGLALRADQWLLPSEQSFLGGILGQKTHCDPIGDCPTLKDGVRAFEVGLTVGYRIAL
jgi:hypothetical protein